MEDTLDSVTHEKYGLFRSVLCGPYASLTEAFERLNFPPWNEISVKDKTLNAIQALIPVPNEEEGNYWELISINDSIFVVITKCNYKSTRQEIVPAEPFIEFHFTLDGETTLTANMDDNIAVQQANIFICRQGLTDYEVYCPAGRRRLLSIYVRPDFMTKKLNVNPDALPQVLGSLFADTHQEMIIQQLPIRLDLENTIQDILNNPFTDMRRLYYNISKIIALLCLCARDLAVLKPTDESTMVFSRRDLAIFNKVREILSTSFSPIPTITSLSKAVGTNTNKLKTGFKILYGMTIFEFGNHHRMMHAHNLLAEKQVPVGNVARLTGYQSQASFAVAFKKFFGELPRDIRRKGIAGTKSS